LCNWKCRYGIDYSIESRKCVNRKKKEEKEREKVRVRRKESKKLLIKV